AAAERFRRIALTHCQGLLLIDVSALERIDAAGVGAWLEIHNKAEHRGGTVIIVNPTLWVREFLRVTQVASVLCVLSAPDQQEVSRARETEFPEFEHLAA